MWVVSLGPEEIYVPVLTRHDGKRGRMVRADSHGTDGAGAFL